MKIAICDDDSAYVKKIESVVRTTIAEKNICLLYTSDAADD